MTEDTGHVLQEPQWEIRLSRISLSRNFAPAITLLFGYEDVEPLHGSTYLEYSSFSSLTLLL